ncbi:MAG TPA: tetratricopeptide repeat protein, partial [Cyclobacteriaceae bacterium]|nr:tetratricopeptide repeat protein [Cyclobacteriaceae bacterium]
MRYCLTILLILEIATGLSQNKPETAFGSVKSRTLDSLEAELKTVSQEKRFKVLLSLFREYLTLNQDKAQQYIGEALVQAKIDNDSLEMVIAYSGTAYLLKSEGRLEAAIELFTDALEISKRNYFKNQIKYMLNNLATSYAVSSAYDKALFYHFESLKLRERDGDAIGISVTLNNIGSIYDLLQDYKNALSFYQRSYETKIKNNVEYDLELTLLNIAMVHNKLNEFKEAENKLNEIKSKCESKVCPTNILISTSNAFGEILLNQKKYAEAQEYFIGSLRLINQNPSTIYSSWEGKGEHLSNTLYWLGFVQLSQNNFKAAISYLMTSLRTAEEFGIQDTMMKSYLLVSEAFASLNNFKLAYEYQNKYVQLNSELLSGKVLSRITELRTSFDQRENLSMIAA